MLAVLASMLLAAAEPAVPSGAGTAPAPVTPAAVAKPKPTDEVCWTERPTGSHIVKRLCATREQLDKAERDGRDALSHNDHRGAAGGFKRS